MSDDPIDSTSGDRFTSRLQGAVRTRWGAVRAFWDGLKLAKASALSVLIGLLMFYGVPQVQDLFLEVRGSALMGTLFWALFYLAILVGWAFPVYVSSRWVLVRFQRNPQARAEAGVFFVEDWVRRAIPPLLAALCFGAVLSGQLMSLSNAPTVIQQSEKGGTILTDDDCFDDGIAKCGVAKYVTGAAKIVTILIAQWVGSERVILVLYTVFAAVAAWLLLGSLARGVSQRRWRIASMIGWGTLTLLVAVPVAVLAIGVLYGLVSYELGQKLNLGHLVLLPLTTVLIGALVWWGLRPGPGEQATRVARLLMRITGNDPAADQNAATGKILSPTYFLLLATTVAIMLLLLVVHPVHATSYIYRALMLPFLLGLLVPVFTCLTYWSARWRVPLVFTVIVLVAIFAARFADTHDVRTIDATFLQRQSLDQSVRRWAAANNCEIKATEQARRFTAPGCPSPFIVSAAGGASRAAFLVGSMMGKLLDENAAPVLEGHEDALSHAIFSPDGRRILTAGSDYTLRLWDAASGSEIAAFVGHRHRVESMAFSPDGKRLLTRSSDWSARLWEVETGRQIALLRETDRQTNSAQFSPDGRRIVTAQSNSIARIWDAEHGKALVTLEGHRGTVETAAFSPDGKRVVTAALDSMARIWDVESGKSIIVLEGHKRALSRAAYSPDGKRILSVSDDEDTARLWDAETGAPLAILEGVDTVEFSPDGRRMVSTVFMSSTAQLWDGVTGKLVANLEGRRTGFANVAFSGDGRRLVMASEAETMLWDAETGKPVAVVKPKIERAVFSPDSRRLLTTDATNVRLWDAETGAAAAVVDAENALMSVAFNPTGDRIVLATPTAVRLWEGKVGDKLSGFFTRTSERASTKQRPLRPFAKQLFAISGVSGGALSTVISYAALADSQTKERATNGLGSPPCLLAYNDSQWFAHYVKSTVAPAVAGAAAWRPHESWRGCLQLLLAGDFLSPVFVSLVSDDLLQIGQRGDRAAALEQAWEMRYATMTGQDRPSAILPKEDPRNPKSRTTLSDSMVFVRDRVLEADPKNWLPIMLLNGTSVTTGRRIIASDVRTLREDDTPGPTGQRIIRVFGDTYDLHELLSSGSGSFMFEDADIRLSTGATMSARFPIISPHGNIRARRDRHLVDRVVDGGYYENFGAITSLELAQALRAYGLTPFVIVVNNEPQAAGMDCVTADSTLPHPKAKLTATFSTLSSPLNALLATGGGRATLAAVQLCSEIGGNNFAYITVQPDKHNPKKALSMSWWLSMHVQKYLDDQLDEDSVNQAAFAKIRAAR